MKRIHGEFGYPLLVTLESGVAVFDCVFCDLGETISAPFVFVG